MEPLRERPFRLLFLGRTLSAVGDAIVPIAVTFAVLEIGDATDLGIVLGSGGIARVLFLVVGGVWADRLPRQLVMMSADAVRAVVQALLAIAFFTDAVAVWQLAVASALLGASSAFFNPASTGLLPQIVSAGHLQEANALLSLSRSAIDVLGPAVSGVVVATLGFGVVFAVDAATFVASFVCLAAMRLPRTIERAKRQTMLADAREGLRVVRERRWIVVTLCSDFVFNIALAAFFVLGPVVVEDNFGGARDWGLVMTVAAIGGLVGGVVVLRYKPRRPLLAGYLIGFAGPLALLILAPPLPLPIVMAGAGLLFLEIVVFNALYMTMQQQHVPNEALARVDALGWTVSLVGFPLAMFVVGPLSGWIGVQATLTVSALIGSAALIGALSSRDVRELSRLDRQTTRSTEPAPARP
jgi:MFS family permease